MLCTCKTVLIKTELTALKPKFLRYILSKCSRGRAPAPPACPGFQTQFLRWRRLWRFSGFLAIVSLLCFGYLFIDFGNSFFFCIKVAKSQDRLSCPKTAYYTCVLTLFTPFLVKNAETLVNKRFRGDLYVYIICPPSP